MTKGFEIIGITVRTTNKNNQAKEDLEKLWGQFFSENLMAKIPNKASNQIFAVYTDYKSNFTEDYTTIIGIPVTTLENIPAGFIGRAFQPENFQKYIAKGRMPEAVVNTWTEIWQNDKTLRRKYTYDLEVYGDQSQQGENSEVDIYIAVK